MSRCRRSFAVGWFPPTTGVRRAPWLALVCCLLLGAAGSAQGADELSRRIDFWSPVQGTGQTNTGNKQVADPVYTWRANTTNQIVCHWALPSGSEWAARVYRVTVAYSVNGKKFDEDIVEVYPSKQSSTSSSANIPLKLGKNTIGCGFTVLASAAAAGGKDPDTTHFFSTRPVIAVENEGDPLLQEEMPGISISSQAVGARYGLDYSKLLKLNAHGLVRGRPYLDFLKQAKQVSATHRVETRVQRYVDGGWAELAVIDDDLSKLVMPPPSVRIDYAWLSTHGGGPGKYRVTSRFKQVAGGTKLYGATDQLEFEILSADFKTGLGGAIAKPAPPPPPGGAGVNTDLGPDLAFNPVLRIANVTGVWNPASGEYGTPPEPLRIAGGYTSWDKSRQLCVTDIVVYVSNLGASTSGSYSLHQGQDSSEFSGFKETGPHQPGEKKPLVGKVFLKPGLNTLGLYIYRSTEPKADADSKNNSVSRKVYLEGSCLKDASDQTRLAAKDLPKITVRIVSGTAPYSLLSRKDIRFITEIASTSVRDLGNYGAFAASSPWEERVHMRIVRTGNLKAGLKIPPRTLYEKSRLVPAAKNGSGATAEIEDMLSTLQMINLGFDSGKYEVRVWLSQTTDKGTVNGNVAARSFTVWDAETATHMNEQRGSGKNFTSDGLADAGGGASRSKPTAPGPDLPAQREGFSSGGFAGPAGREVPRTKSTALEPDIPTQREQPASGGFAGPAGRDASRAKSTAPGPDIPAQRGGVLARAQAAPLVFQPKPGSGATDRLRIEIHGQLQNSKQYEVEIEALDGSWKRVYQRALGSDAQGKAYQEVNLVELATPVAGRQWRLRARGLAPDTPWSSWVAFTSELPGSVQPRQRDVKPAAPAAPTGRLGLPRGSEP